MGDSAVLTQPFAQSHLAGPQSKHHTAETWHLHCSLMSGPPCHLLAAALCYVKHPSVCLALLSLTAAEARLCASTHALPYIMLPALQGYAWEITTAEGGWGLDGVLRERSSKLNGITNGIDMEEWDPSKDQLLASTYSSSDLSGVPAPLMSPLSACGLPSLAVPSGTGVPNHGHL